MCNYEASLLKAVISAKRLFFHRSKGFMFKESLRNRNSHFFSTTQTFFVVVVCLSCSFSLEKLARLQGTGLSKIELLYTTCDIFGTKDIFWMFLEYFVLREFLRDRRYSRDYNYLLNISQMSRNNLNTSTEYLLKTLRKTFSLKLQSS